MELYLLILLSFLAMQSSKGKSLGFVFMLKAIEFSYGKKDLNSIWK